MSFQRRCRAVLACTSYGFAICAVLLTAAAGARADEAAGAGPYPRLATFARALAHIENSYVGEVDQDALIEGAIRGMLKVLDPHSAYLDPKQLRLLESDTEGRFGGVGVEIDLSDGWLTVVRVMPQGPAARAGLLPGDRFLTIEGNSARDLPFDEAIEKMRGEPGTQVHITLRRRGVPEAVAVTLTREIIAVEAVTARVLPDRVVYVQLREFQENTAADLRRVLDEAVERTAAQGGVRGVLLDLRDNPGGLLSSAVLVADEFLSDGVIVSTRARGGKLLRENRATAGGTRPGWPLVLLVNGYSASASEIVAGALHDHKRAVLVGTRTFGKGSVQNVIDLPDGSALKLTTALYYTPSGSSIQAKGIEPDVVVEQLDSKVLHEARLGGGELTEASLEGHLLVGPTPPAAPASGQGDRAAPKRAVVGASGPTFADDYQAMMAYQVLKALIASAPGAR
jgi:carboxyl-terminal processing protease